MVVLRCSIKTIQTTTPFAVDNAVVIVTIVVVVVVVVSVLIEKNKSDEERSHQSSPVAVLLFSSLSSSSSVSFLLVFSSPCTSLLPEPKKETDSSFLVSPKVMGRKPKKKTGDNE